MQINSQDNTRVTQVTTAGELVVTTGSGTYYLAKTGGYKTCQNGEWELQDSGQFKCSSNQNLEWCYSISGRRCYLGNVIKVETPTKEVATSTNYSGGSYINCQGRVWLIDDVAVLNDSTKIFNTNLEKTFGECKNG